ncbi:MAG: AAA family ATPase [Mycolicibacterium fortuitum]
MREGELNLEAGRLTVLTGVNSSGKSSALQSILLMTQSLYHSGGIVLNGPLVRLGEAKDLVRTGDSTGQLGIRLEVPEFNWEGVPDDHDTIVANTRLNPSADGSALYATRVELRHADEPDTGTVVLDRSRSRGADLKTVSDATLEAADEQFLHLKSTFSGDSKILRAYVRMEGLKPVELIQVSDVKGVAGRYRSQITSFLKQIALGKYDPIRTRSNLDEDEISLFVIVSEFIDLISSAVQAHRSETNEKLMGLIDNPTVNPFRFVRQWKSFDAATQAEAIDLAVESRSDRPYIRIGIESSYSSRILWRQTGLLERRLQQTISSTLGALRSLSEGLHSLSYRVQYLGPLRDEPRVVWNQWNELSRGLPVGTRGEYSAVRLSQSAQRKIKYGAPNGDAVIGTLSDAVNEWLTYLRIGDSVSAKTEGKLGVRVELKLAGHARDLTAVGVGVSQALPLVVALLLVPEDAIFIVEQPELHLHPAVQARLADFMLNARPDVACVVETHSEAFVTRIRRRVAEDEIDTSRVNIVFVEPGDSGSTMRSLTITEFGDLSEWPVGFISGEDEDARAILAANLRRVRSSDGRN